MEPERGTVIAVFFGILGLVVGAVLYETALWQVVIPPTATPTPHPHRREPTSTPTPTETPTLSPTPTLIPTATPEARRKDRR
jgi:hypothetical protein